MEDLEALATGKQFTRLAAENELLQQKIKALTEFIEKHREVLEEAENASKKSEVPKRSKGRGSSTS